MVLTLSACGTKNDPQQPPKDYTKILTEARDQEENDYLPIVGKGEDGKPTLTHNPLEMEADQIPDYVDMLLQMTGIGVEDLEDYAISASLMNISVYNITILKPVKGKEEAAVKALEAYRTLQQQAFEHYLPDQYRITLDARVETLPTGEVVLVMCNGSDQVFADLAAKLAA